MYRLILACLCLFWCVSCTTAQDTPPTSDHPLVTMLKRTPMRFANEELYYLDFRAVEDALAYVDRPPAGQIFYNDWTGYAQRWVSAPRILDMLLPARDTYMVMMGFELRDVNRLFTFGALPDTATIWWGEFDEEAIRNAHLARGFSPVIVQDAEAWCYSGDCSTDIEINLRGRGDGNLFNSGTGNSVPFLIWDDLLISTLQQTILEALARVADGDSLYDNPDIRALAQASTATEGLLVNWIVIPAVNADMMSGVEVILDDLKSQVADTYNPLPMYNAVAIADRQEGDDMVALVMVVYADESTAQTAAIELEARIANFNDYINRRSATLEPIWSSVSGFSISQSVYVSDMGRYVAVIRMAYDTPTEEQAFGSSGSGNAVLPDARVFQRIWRSFIMRDFYPLWTGLGE